MTEVPFSRLVAVRDVPPLGTHVTLTAEAGERAALAKLLKLSEVKRLEARLHVKPWGRDGLAVTGEVEADVVQTCVVTLEPFDAEVREEIEVRYTAEDAGAGDLAPGAEHEADLDAPDVLVNGSADLGALAAEHVALGLDPYPRKPGVEASTEPAPESEPGTHRPFAGLGDMLGQGKGKKN